MCFFISLYKLSKSQTIASLQFIGMHIYTRSNLQPGKKTCPFNSVYSKESLTLFLYQYRDLLRKYTYTHKCLRAKECNLIFFFHRKYSMFVVINLLKTKWIILQYMKIKVKTSFVGNRFIYVTLVLNLQ